jgi:hypothetical protein
MSAEREAGFQALQRSDIAAAIEQLERACQQNSEDYEAHLYLGAAYGKAGRQMDAINILTKAVQLQPANAQARYNLGVAMESGGYKEQAIQALQQALALQPDYPKAQEALQRLQPSSTPPPFRSTSSSFGASPANTPESSPGYGVPPASTSTPGYGVPPASTPQPGYGQQPPQTGYGAPTPYTPPGYSQQPGYGQQPPPTGYTPPGYGPSSYGGPPSIYQQGQPYGPPLTCSEANESLIWAIVGMVTTLFCCGLILGPIAIIRANTAKRIIAANPQMMGSSATATAGLIIGSIVTIINVLGLILMIISMANAH